MPKSIVVGVVLAAPILAFVACSSKTRVPAVVGVEDSGGAALGPVPAPASASVAVKGPVTFHKDIEPLLQRSCQSCHSPGKIASFPLVTYADAKDMAPLMADMTTSRKMPPWGAHETSECKPRFPWKDDLRLTAAHIATFKAWSEQGAPEGDSKDSAHLRLVKAPPMDLIGANTLAPRKPYSLKKKAVDAIRCFVMDPKLTKTTYMTASHFVPKNRTIVHHALAFAIPAGAATPGGADDEYDCPGGPRVPGASLIAAWAPGGVPSRYPEDVALPLEAGAKIVMQVHYHPHARATSEADRTTFQYATTDKVPAYVVEARLIGNFRAQILPGIGLMPGPADGDSGAEFRVPRGAKRHTETMAFTMPPFFNGQTIGKMRILNVGAHMHIVGVDEKISIVRAQASPGQPAEECLLQEPQWSFDWQRAYQYDAPIETLPIIAPGDKLEMRCTYDNTMGNLKLKAALAEKGKREPEDVHLGEETLDEMCLAAISFVRPR